MKFKSWLATLIIGLNIILSCNNTYSLRSTEDFMEAARLITLRRAQPKADLHRISILSNLLLELCTYVNFCEERKLGPIGFLLSPRKPLPPPIPFEAMQFNTCEQSNFKIIKIIPNPMELTTARDLILTILTGTPNDFKQLFLENPTHTTDTMILASAMCQGLIDSVVQIL